MVKKSEKKKPARKINRKNYQGIVIPKGAAIRVPIEAGVLNFEAGDLVRTKKLLELDAIKERTIRELRKAAGEIIIPLGSILPHTCEEITDYPSGSKLPAKTFWYVFNRLIGELIDHRENAPVIVEKNSKLQGENTRLRTQWDALQIEYEKLKGEKEYWENLAEQRRVEAEKIQNSFMVARAFILDAMTGGVSG